ncbi:MAG: hypothetical protein KDK27_12515 [Leptospiraceae bacterium]|nr:hypothetical protein [Leptospiraceae bacterium]
MRTNNLSKMFKGWFIGDFDPTLLNTSEFEVAVKKYAAGESEEKHYHKIATEYTVIVQGHVKMNGVEYVEGDIIVMEPGEATDFTALTDATTTVVKVPCVKGDKYLCNE